MAAVVLAGLMPPSTVGAPPGQAKAFPPEQAFGRAAVALRTSVRFLRGRSPGVRTRLGGRSPGGLALVAAALHAPDLWHPRAAGHHVAADALAAALVARGLVPPATE